MAFCSSAVGHSRSPGSGAVGACRRRMSGRFRKALVQIQASSNRGMKPHGGGVEVLMGSRWTESADTAVRLAAALDWEHGGRRLVDLAERLGRTEGAVRQRASRLRAVQLEGDVDLAGGGVGVDS